ncbi:hypothetical protein EJB05_17855 [Eragrostis curvula]|uniref:C3H1-type domain-containing protein n=1 Tax=Eragrostis curvula TaxID=38414 RepID=A0A5J9VJK3_9POAL|nr:hypothetical protein EJB05_17855 [Eragrostis curvula]
MSDPFHPYTGGGGFQGAGSGGGGGFPGAGSGGDGAPPRRYSDYEVDLIAARYADVPLPNLSPADVPLPHLSPVEVGYFDAHVGARRSAEVLYHHSIMGSHSTIGQSEPLYSSNTMVKRPRLESSLTILPQRPGGKACAFYMRSRTCKFGEGCIFDHPQWVPEGGIPNWREVQDVDDSYPERPGEPDCPGKVNEFKGVADNEQSLIADSAVLPARPSQSVCSFYAKTGKCKFGAKCRFNHPKDDNVPTLTGKQTIYTAAIDEEVYNGAADGLNPAKTDAPAAPAEEHNAKGLPIRPGEIDCSFYMKTGSCMYGSICRYNHPDRPVVDTALIASVAQGILPTPAPAAPMAVLNPVATFLPGFDIQAALVPVEPEPVVYPQRPGETVCDFYMKTGHCKYSEKCKFHHPIDRSAPRPNESWDPQQSVTITLAGLPRREGAEVCAFYMRSGTCKFGVQCKFDHPPPAEAITKLQAAGGKKSGKKAKAVAKLMAAAEKKAEGLSVVLAEPAEP